jgi:hypothetical protein
MKTEQEVTELQAIAIMYIAKHEMHLDTGVVFALQVVSDFMCFLLNHDCDENEGFTNRFAEMRETLEADGLNIKEAVEYVKMREAANKRHEAAINN